MKKELFIFSNFTNIFKFNSQVFEKVKKGCLI